MKTLKISPKQSAARKDPKGQSGQSLVEFAVSLVVLLILISVIIEAGFALFTYMALRDAAQEGALYGSLQPADSAGMITRITNNSDLIRGMNVACAGLACPKAYITDIDITVSGTACVGDPITVQITAKQRITAPFVGSFLPSGQDFDISASVTDTVLRPKCP